MESLSHHEVTMMLVSLGLLLGVARILGECAQRFHQPAVVGEVLAGILLGPTVLGNLAPELSGALFPTHGSGALVLNGFTTLAITLFLLVAGMEVDLSTVWRQGQTAVRIGFTGVAFPFAFGFVIAWFAPDFLGREDGADALIFALFFAVAISISALPIVVKILMDLNLYRSDYGMMVVAACVLNDLIGWMGFAIILGMAGDGNHDRLPIVATIGLTVGFTAVVLTAGRWVFNKIVPWLQAYTHWPGGVLGFAICMALFGGAFTEWVGVHAILGSFMVGVAIGDSPHLRQKTRMIIDQFVSFIFAPLFFASIGLYVNFAAHFDIGIVSAVMVTALFGKFFGCLLGARWAKLRWRESVAVGSSMISVGAMGIIIGLLALEHELISQRLFVAIVLMALVTSMISGPMVQLILGQRKPRTVEDFLAPVTYCHRLSANTREEAIRELAGFAAQKCRVDPEAIAQAVQSHEEIMSTGIGNGVAVPHARMSEIKTPVVALGISEVGVDFDAPDGEVSHLIFLILTSQQEDGSQLDIISSIGSTFHDHMVSQNVLTAINLTEVLAIMRGETEED